LRKQYLGGVRLAAGKRPGIALIKNHIQPRLRKGEQKMKKRIFAVLAAALAVVTLLASCAQSAPAPSPSGSGNAPSGSGEKTLKVAIVVNQKFGDNGPMDDLAKGADKAAADFGVEIKKLESASAANFEEDVAHGKSGLRPVVTTFRI
jgi:basic membrane protein A